MLFYFALLVILHSGWFSILCKYSFSHDWNFLFSNGHNLYIIEISLTKIVLEIVFLLYGLFNKYASWSNMAAVTQSKSLLIASHVAWGSVSTRRNVKLCLWSQLCLSCWFYSVEKGNEEITEQRISIKLLVKIMKKIRKCLRWWCSEWMRGLNALKIIEKLQNWGDF